MRFLAILRGALAVGMAACLAATAVPREASATQPGGRFTRNEERATRYDPFGSEALAEIPLGFLHANLRKIPSWLHAGGGVWFFKQAETGLKSFIAMVGILGIGRFALLPLHFDGFYYMEFQVLIRACLMSAISAATLLTVSFIELVFHNYLIGGAEPAAAADLTFLGAAREDVDPSAGASALSPLEEFIRTVHDIGASFGLGNFPTHEIQTKNRYLQIVVGLQAAFLDKQIPALAGEGGVRDPYSALQEVHAFLRAVQQDLFPAFERLDKSLGFALENSLVLLAFGAMPLSGVDTFIKRTVVLARYAAMDRDLALAYAILAAQTAEHVCGIAEGYCAQDHRMLRESFSLFWAGFNRLIMLAAPSENVRLQLRLLSRLTFKAGVIPAAEKLHDVSGLTEAHEWIASAYRDWFTKGLPCYARVKDLENRGFAFLEDILEAIRAGHWVTYVRALCAFDDDPEALAYILGLPHLSNPQVNKVWRYYSRRTLPWPLGMPARMSNEEARVVNFAFPVDFVLGGINEWELILEARRAMDPTEIIRDWPDFLQCILVVYPLQTDHERMARRIALARRLTNRLERKIRQSIAKGILLARKAEVHAEALRILREADEMRIDGLLKLAIPRQQPRLRQNLRNTILRITRSMRFRDILTLKSIRGFRSANGHPHFVRFLTVLYKEAESSA